MRAGAHRHRLASILTVTLLSATMSVAGSPAHADQHIERNRPDRIAQQISDGLQLAQKGAASPGGLNFDPSLALLPAEARGKVNFLQADVDRGAHGKLRAAQRNLAGLAAATSYAEKEPAGTLGANDTVPTAERIAGFGTGDRQNSAVAIAGDLADDPDIPTLPAGSEDNGSIPLAIDTGVAGARQAVRTSGVIGDGPHGSAGDGHGDFDFYKVSGVPAGVPLTMDVGAQGDLNAIMRLYDANGGTVFWADDPSSGNVSVSLPLPSTGDYYLMVAGSGPNIGSPTDPNDPASGAGAGSEGAYSLKLSTEQGGDQDVYGVNLKAGDVVGATVTGSAHHLSFYDAAGTELMGSTLDASGSYASASPLPGGGNATVDLVAPRAGRYYLAVSNGVGAYRAELEAYRPGTEVERRGTVQTLFLDFDGARVNTSIFGAGGAQHDLSPLSAFLPGWGLGPADENKVIDAVVASVKENIATDLATKGTDPHFAVRVLNSRDNPDPFGRPNVSRVVVGGTIAESGIPTIGISSSIDPGNYGHEDTALVLLDLLSAAAPNPNSLNTYLGPQSDRIGFIGRGLGNIITHEIGHYSGNWHTDQFDDTANLMDQGGNIAQMLGVGADGIGGTADDVDVDFTTDSYTPQEPFTGSEDTLDTTAWAYSRGLG
ncbi:PPC domain-containing protein [Streptomyces sp. NPDC051572]|uniref:PPC domain-containing protein n=1 Tax=Streptomyces sp. NPDC051572 TaxID=3155802 RepID=UPI00344BFA12